MNTSTNTSTNMNMNVNMNVNMNMNMQAFLKAEVAEVLRLMDDSADTGTALREVLFRVYTLGVRKGVEEGYAACIKDRERDAAKNRNSPDAVCVDRGGRRDGSTG